MIRSRLFDKIRKNRIPEQAELRDRITFALIVYMRVRGLKSLFHPDTALAARKNFEVFVMNGAEHPGEPATLLGIFRLKDVSCFAEFEKVYGDAALRAAPLGKITLGHLADQLAATIIERATVSVDGTQNGAAPKKDVIVLTTLASAETDEKKNAGFGYVKETILRKSRLPDPKKRAIGRE